MSELSVALGSLPANGWGCGPVLLVDCHPVLELASHWAKPVLRCKPLGEFSQINSPWNQEFSGGPSS